MSLDCLNKTIRFANATLQSVEATQPSHSGWFIGSCVLSSSLVANGWLFSVSWGNTYIDGIFKYPVCYLAFCDVCLALVRISHSTLHLFVDASTYLHYCAVVYALSIAGVNAIFGALIPAPLQRCLLIFYVPWLSDHAQRPRSILAFCAVLFILSTAPSFVGILAPPDLCLRSPVCPQMPFTWLSFVLERCTFVLSYVAAVLAILLFVWKVKELNSLVEQLAAGANVQPPSSVNMNRDILGMAIVQTINPILLTAPMAVAALGWALGLVTNPSTVLTALGVFQLNPLMDALSTIYFIKPYRRLALKTAKRIRQIIHKQNVVNWTPTVVVTPAGPAKPNDHWRVTIGTPASPIQPLPQIEN